VSLSQLDLNLLLVLDTVLTERSVVRAARRLHVTSSAVSNALARLRSALRDPLVTRSGRGVVPTPRAKAMAAPLKRVLNDLEQVVQGEVFDPNTTTEQFTLALADAGQVAWLPGLVKRFAREMPRGRLRVVGIDTYLSSGGLQGTEVDVALVAVLEAAPGLHSVPLYTEQSVLVARRSNPKVRQRLTIALLRELQHVEVQVAPGRGYRELARSYQRLGIERKVVVVVPSFVAAAAVVAQTDFVATVPARLVEVLGERLGLQVLGGPAPRVTGEIKLGWHQRTHDDPAMRAFRDLVVRSSTVSARTASPRPRS
jgi:DNA-binding transcriptional LysR family regulator